MVREAVALQPAERGFQLGKTHRRPALAHDTFENGIVGMVVGLAAEVGILVLDHLGRHQLTDLLAQPVLALGRRLHAGEPLKQRAGGGHRTAALAARGAIAAMAG
jgi:hypothetical protein